MPVSPNIVCIAPWLVLGWKITFSVENPVASETASRTRDSCSSNTLKLPKRPPRSSSVIARFSAATVSPIGAARAKSR